MPRKPLSEMTDEDVEASLSPEERAESEALLQGLEDGTVISILTPELRADIEAAAGRTMERLARKEQARKTGETTQISLRLPTADLLTLQEEAAVLGMKYQSLLKSILHQYLTGSLVPASRPPRP